MRVPSNAALILLAGTALVLGLIVARWWSALALVVAVAIALLLAVTLPIGRR